MVEIVSSVEVSVVGGGAGNSRDPAVGSGDFGVAGRGARWRNCCKFPEIFRKLCKDLPYSLPFTFNFDDVFLSLGGY